MLKREILLTGCAIVLALSGHETLAAEACTTVPTCAELGYTQTDCEGFVSLKCPFDKNKLFCGSTCLSGYTYGQITKKCGTRNPDIIYSGNTPIAVAINNKYAIALKDEASRVTFDEAYNACDTKSGGNWSLPSVEDFQVYKQQKSTIDALISQIGGRAPSGLYAIEIDVSSNSVVEYDATTGQVIIDSSPDYDGFFSRCFMYLN